MLARCFKIERSDFMKKDFIGKPLLIIPTVGLLVIWILYLIFEK
jgi:hypothetical protein